MIDSLRRFMPEEVRWTEPDGGLFLFITLPEYLDSQKVLEKAVERNVAFVTGSVFFCNDAGRNTMRLNFSFCNKKDIEEGVKRLAEVISQFTVGRK